MENKAGEGITDEKLLARFIRLCSAVLSAPKIQESAALVVNRISEIVRVDRAVLVSLNNKQAILAVTGGGIAAQDSAFADAIEDVRRRYRDRDVPVIIPRVMNEHQFSPHLKKVQEAMGGSHILWVPLWLSRENEIPAEYALWLERWNNVSWEKPDIEFLRHAALFFGHSLVRRRKVVSRLGKRLIRMAAILTIIIVLGLPVSSSVTAPIRVAPDQPHHIFAPMDGILKELLVLPGQKVKVNDIVFRYDSRVLDKRLDEAYRNVAVAKAKLAKIEGAAYRDPEARAELPVQKLEVERAEADVVFFTNQQTRAEVRTAKPGMIVLDDPDALIGAALQTGQLVLSVADPAQTKLRLMVPASDVGFLKEGAQVEVRLDSNPLRTLPAVITRIGFDIKISEEQIPSLLAEAVWRSQVPEVQPGQKGVAKISGSSTYLGMQILRKPLIKLRSFVGF